MRTISLITVLAIATIVLFAGCSKSQTSDKPVETLKVSEPSAQLSSESKDKPVSLQTYKIIGTGQTRCYSNWSEIQPPKSGEPFYGQDAQHPGLTPSYKNDDDGTVSDNNTGLMWVQARGSKMTWDAAVAGAKACRVGGYTDWRMPTIKELYSLINFNGGFHPEGNSLPYLDSRHFEFVYGNTQLGERPIDCQDWSSIEYIGRTMGNNPTVFGVNFADGRIKGYPKAFPNGRAGTLYARYVRGNPAYGRNDFQDNNNGTITDKATGLMWSKADSGQGMNWETALAWVQKLNGKKYLGYNDWRLPNAKELQSIVDYTRAPAVTKSAAISPVFTITKLSDGEYPFFWTSTTHLDGPPEMQGSAAIYIAFGRATGWMGNPQTGTYQLMDVHGAGAQRSDPKAGDPRYFPYGRGPQGDVIRIYNFVRCVRNAK